MGCEERLNKILAVSFVSRIIEHGLDANFLRDLNFRELESLFKSTLEQIDSSHEVRTQLVKTLKSFQEKYGDLNILYNAHDIASEKDLMKMFMR